jgi:hypothetical protein
MHPMKKAPTFATIGEATDTIDVRLSYRIVELFSEGLYQSPNKAIEELVANSFDAGALRVVVLLSPNMHEQDSTIAVVDDGEGMDAARLKQHWLIGLSNKRALPALPRGRQQIGKFGIGKLATYVLANRLTHISKNGGKYYSTSMDFSAISARVDKEVEPKTPIRIPLRELDASEAQLALKLWIDTPAFRATRMRLFGRGAPHSWTVAIMSSLKPKVHELKAGFLAWVLSTALPLRPDFGIWLDGRKLVPSKEGKGLIRRWVLGKDLIKLPKPAPKGVTPRDDPRADGSSEEKFGLEVPGLGRVTGYAEAYKDLLTGKSDELGRSHGFFVFVFGRLVNVVDGHFGISPNELRHGTFGRFRLVVRMDGLDEVLRSNREAVSEGPILETVQNVLQAVFNFVRPTIEGYDLAEEPGAALARKLAASPASLSRSPIVDLARTVVEGKGKSRYLIVPQLDGPEGRAQFIASLEKRASAPDTFVSGLTIDYNGSQDDGIARYDTATGFLRINAWHPFVATFYDEFSAKGKGRPLELLAMAEVLAEGHLHAIGVKKEHIESFLTLRDQLLRNLANESGRQSALSTAGNLLNARNNPDGLEESLCAAFRSLGFDVTPFRKRGQPDGVATAHLAAADDGNPRRYSVSLEAKSKEKPGARVSAKSVGISTIARQRDQFECDHALVVGPAFPTSQGDNSALAVEIQDDRRRTAAEGRARTITLITIDDLAKLVRLRPVKQVGLRQVRGLFEQCQLPEQSHAWVESIRATRVRKPPYKEVVEAIQALQRKYKQAPVKYAALRVALSHRVPPIEYETDEPLVDLCKAMGQMAPGAMFAGPETVELDQSADNVVGAIEAAMRDYPPDEQGVHFADSVARTGKLKR